MKKKKLKALNNYLLCENISLKNQLENKKTIVYIVTKRENILFDHHDQRTIYYLPRKINDKLDFKVFFDYNDACSYVKQSGASKLHIIKSEIS